MRFLTSSFARRKVAFPFSAAATTAFPSAMSPILYTSCAVRPQHFRLRKSSHTANPTVPYSFLGHVTFLTLFSEADCMRERGLLCMSTTVPCATRSRHLSRVSAGDSSSFSGHSWFFWLHFFVCSLYPAAKNHSASSLPLTETVPLRFEGLPADANIICSVLGSALHPQSLGVVTNSFRPLVVESGDEGT